MIIAYKGFEPDLTCRGFQYELGKTYSLPERPKLCEQGFHACILPIDVIQYYSPSTSVYAKVKLSECDVMKDLYDFAFDTKICGRRIWISTRKICIDELIYETFYLLDQLAVFANLDRELPSKYYHRAVKTSVKQLEDEESIAKRIEATIRFAHTVLGFIIKELMDSSQIFDVEDFIQIVIKLQQNKGGVNHVQNRIEARGKCVRNAVSTGSRADE